MTRLACSNCGVYIQESTMDKNFDELIVEAGLSRIAPVLAKFTLPAIGFALTESRCPGGSSKLGGNPSLRADFDWPVDKDRPLDFLAQINLEQVKRFDTQGLLPETGLLSFFYDIENQPKGCDPNNLGGFRIIYTPNVSKLSEAKSPNTEFVLPECRIDFYEMKTVPHVGSRALKDFVIASEMTEKEAASYNDLSFEIELFYSSDLNNHHLLGHATNVQGDMQLEAQLVSGGLNCGGSSGFEDPRCAELESDADEWILLLQLDSDETRRMQWGNCGILYFWIRKEDLANRRFDKAWMTLQCD